jgi:hypothetical protein
MTLTQTQRQELFIALRGEEIPSTERLSPLDELIGHDVDAIEPIIVRWLSENCSLEGCTVATNHIHTPTGPR